MKRKILVFFLLIGLVGSASADLDSSIRQNCQVNEEPVFSMYSKTGGNIGMPGFYDWQVCVEGIEYAEIKDSCSNKENSIISMFEKNDSHASIDSSYRWDVCAPQLKTNLSQSCELPIASMHSETDSHVAEPGYYSNQLCASFEQPENVSIELEFDANQVYVDDSEAEERTYNTLELAYPYIVSDQPAGIVSHGELLELEYSSDTDDIFRVTQDKNSASVLLPFTQGGYTEIEDDENDVLDRVFLNRNLASFGFPSVDVPTIRVRKEFKHSVTGFEDVETSQLTLSVRNKINNNDSVEIVVRSVG